MTLRAGIQSVSVFDLARSWGLECFPLDVLWVPVLVLSVGGVNEFQCSPTVLLALGMNLN